MSSPLAHCWPKFSGVATFHREGLGSVVVTLAGCVLIDLWKWGKTNIKGQLTGFAVMLSFKSFEVGKLVPAWSTS